MGVQPSSPQSISFHQSRYAQRPLKLKAPNPKLVDRNPLDGNGTVLSTEVDKLRGYWEGCGYLIHLSGRPKGTIPHELPQG
jgi:hypothetical protein